MSRLARGVLVFFVSAVVLLLEILAARLLAPYLGVSLETYSGIIGVVLAGLALGTWWGGKLADQGDPARRLGPLLVAGGALTLAVLPIVRFLGGLGLGHGPVAILVFAAGAFLAPSVVLSAVHPAVVKLALTDLGRTGRTVGALSALGTAGALAGTFVTGFVLVSTLPTRPILLVAGGALVVVGVIVHAKPFPFGGVTAAVCAGLFSAFVPSPCDVESAYFCASVEPRGAVKTLVLDGVKHAALVPEDPVHLELDYAKAVGAVFATLDAGALDGLFIGGGGFHLPRYLLATHPGATARVLELDRALVEIGHAELGLPNPPPLSVAIGDARVLLRGEPRGKYGVVLGDAFGSQAVPWHLTTREFLGEVRAAMKPGGVYVANVIDAPPLRFARAQVRTLREVFRHVAVLAPADRSKGINLVLVASDDELDGAALTDALRGLGSAFVVTATARGLDAFVKDAPVLTDDFAPVDQLLTVN